MLNFVHFAPICSKGAKRIQRLQKQLFPCEQTESIAKNREILPNTEPHLVCTLSFDVFQDAAIIGYVIAYVDTESPFYDEKIKLSTSAIP